MTDVDVVGVCVCVCVCVVRLVIVVVSIFVVAVNDNVIVSPSAIEIGMTVFMAGLVCYGMPRRPIRARYGTDRLS